MAPKQKSPGKRQKLTKIECGNAEKGFFVVFYVVEYP
jgi:hypothetical protein